MRKLFTTSLCSICAFLLLAVVSTQAQVTTSSIAGTVKQQSGEALVGATVKATHLPTGTVYLSKTTQGGRYNIGNVQPGGPFKVVVTYVGFSDQALDDIQLTLGETGRFDFTMLPTATELKESVVVTGTRRQQMSAKGGVQTVIGTDKLENAPTVGRQLTDFIRLTPQARTTYNGGISIAGQNNRYNQIMFDGAVNNDVFGLSESGTNGGQTGSSPISIDAIESFQVGVSPYDVALGNFTGGSINAVTKSGTNTLKGSAYYINRNESITGKTPTGSKDAATRVPDFTNNIFGATLGGPIIKNKLFFFVSAENEEGDRPQPFDASVIQNQSFRDTIRLIQQKLATYGYDPGEWENIPDIIKSTKIAGKLTWNINAKHRLIGSYRFTKSERSLTSPSIPTQIRFFNGGYLFPSTTNSASLELNSSISSKASNKLLVTYTKVNDDRDALGGDFPRVQLNSVNTAVTPQYVFGTEEFSTANQLIQDNFAVFDEFKWNVGRKHQLKAGIDVEYSESYNLFIRQAFGSYVYSSAAQWLNDRNPNVSYNRSFSLIDDKVGDGSEAAAKFNSLRFGAFVGDQWDVTEKFQVNFGIRVDNFEFLTTPKEDTFFNKYALGQINQFYDTRGIRSGQRPQANLSLSPRIGFTYTIDELGMKLRGGIGLFTGRVPLVWPGGAYNNTGVTIGAMSVTNQTDLAKLTFRPDPDNQWKPSDIGQTTRVPSGQLDFIDPDFRLPKVLKTSLGVDKTFKDGWKLVIDGLFQKNINEVDYKNVMGRPGLVNAFGQNTFWQTSARTYQAIDMDPRTAGNQNPYAEGIFIVTNAEGRKGFSYNFSVAIDKGFRNGWAANATYSFGDSYSVFDGTSSQNNSNWRFMEALNGRNNLTNSRSDFAQMHRVNVYLSKKFTYLNKHLATTVTLFYNGQNGSPYSFVYSAALIGDRTGNTGETNDLVYVPKDFADWQKYATTYTTGTGANARVVSVQEQWTALDAFISDNDYLNKRRGQFAERNGALLPWSHVVDGRIQQDFAFKAGNTRQRFAVIFDVFNLTNMLNRSWGRVYRSTGVDQAQLITFGGYRTDMTPILTYRNLAGTKPYFVQDVSGSVYNVARWRGQFTVRYYFN